MIKNKFTLNWAVKLANLNIRRKHKLLTGFTIRTVTRSFNKVTLLDGRVMAFNNKHLGKLTSSFVLRCRLLKTIFFVQIPIFLSGSFRYKKIGFTFGKNVKSSRLRA